MHIYRWTFFGEYSALCAFRALSLEETAKLLQNSRGSSMAKWRNQRAMAAILGVEIEVAHAIANEAAENEVLHQIANDNSVGQVVISGSKAAIKRAIEIAKLKVPKRALSFQLAVFS